MDASQILTATVSGSITPAEAALSLTAPVAAVLTDAEATENALWDTWTTVLAFAVRTNHEQQGPLVALVSNIKQLRGASGEAVTFEFWGQPTTWSELPSFGPVLREQYDVEYYAEGDGFVNFNAFAARLTADGVLDLSLYGIWTLRDALEDQLPDSSYAQTASRALAAAAVWFLYAGHTMWELSKQNETLEGRVAAPGKTVADKEWNGYNAERWALWVERFKKVHEMGVKEDVRDVVQRAVERTEEYA
ncbi:hypothetical protein MPH_01950 [Macrophomina phaseolina MS6]|uniref:Uncharacterized protein n=1 Tax=Macrophomina phaseolina (strain MS6) TaxID=1126212 RepID=K2S199_MACPH|nr:hypothetical protein MPH_01950 [Macrophomina phaseolina MS6]